MKQGLRDDRWNGVCLMELRPITRVQWASKRRLPGGRGASTLTLEAQNQQIPASLLLAFAPLHKLALGVACGVVLGGGIFFVTAALLFHGGHAAFAQVGLLGQYFFGYSPSWPGAFIGLLWGFGIGFVFGWLFALLRNFVFWVWLTVVRSRAEMEQYSDFLDHL